MENVPGQIRSLFWRYRFFNALLFRQPARLQVLFFRAEVHSTAPVNDILQYITNALPQIQKEAGITVLISKWDEAQLKKQAGAQRVDVTLKLVDAFHPAERQRKRAIEIQNHKPISIKQAEKMKD